MNEEIIEQIVQGCEEIKEQKKKLAEKLQINFKDIFIPFFEKYESVNAIGWMQYVPYFNDGEACVFERHDFSFTTLDDYEDVSGWAYGCPTLNYKNTTEVSEYWLKEQPKLTVEMISDFIEISKKLSQIDDEIYEEVFGEHATILVTREGITVEEYTEHD
jgi:hypothetical protein